MSMPERTPEVALRAASEQALEAVHAATHAARGEPTLGLDRPADVAATLAALDNLLTWLPQLCSQLAEVLDGAAERGTLTGSEEAPEVASRALVAGAASWLEDARRDVADAYYAVEQIGGKL